MHIHLTCDQLVSTCVGWPNGEKLVSTCVRIWTRPKSTQVNASGWPNETQVERKSKTCIDLGVHLAIGFSWAHCSALVSASSPGVSELTQRGPFQKWAQGAETSWRASDPGKGRSSLFYHHSPRSSSQARARWVDARLHVLFVHVFLSPYPCNLMRWNWWRTSYSCHRLDRLRRLYTDTVRPCR